VRHRCYRLRDCRGESSRVNWLADVGQVDRDDSHGLLDQGDYQAHFTLNLECVEYLRGLRKFSRSLYNLADSPVWVLVIYWALLRQSPRFGHIQRRLSVPSSRACTIPGIDIRDSWKHEDTARLISAVEGVLHDMLG
jgi:hypothetical protein